MILSIEPDHFDCFTVAAEVEAAFARFRAAGAGGRAVAGAPTIVPPRGGSSPGWPAAVESFGSPPTAIGTAAEPARPARLLLVRAAACGEPGLRSQAAVPGRHNVLNALAAAALASHSARAADAIRGRAGEFRGLRRRLECWATVGERGWSTTMPTIRRKWRPRWRRSGRCIPGGGSGACFSRTRPRAPADLLDELARSLQNADKIVVAEIFRARENRWRRTRSPPPTWPSALPSWGCDAQAPGDGQPKFSEHLRQVALRRATCGHDGGRRHWNDRA